MPTKKMKMTVRKVEGIKTPESGRDVYKDATTPGLYLDVSVSGRKAYYFRRKIRGRVKNIKIGEHPGTTVAQARKEAAKLYGDAAQGKDITKGRRGHGAPTLGEVFERYMTEHVRPRTKSAKENQRLYDKELKKWATRRLDSIKPKDVAALRDRIARRKDARSEKNEDETDRPLHYAANRVLGLLSTVYNWAAANGIEAKNPVKPVKRFKEQSRDRYLQPDELKRLFKAMNDEPDKIWRDYFTIALMTGARRANVCAMRWADVDLERGLWRIPEAESKNSEPLMVVLHPRAVEILSQRRQANPDGDFVFPGNGRTGHIVEPKGAWQRIRERAGIPDVRVHDLRRTLASYAAIAGTPLNIVGRALGQRSLAATQIYAKLSVDPVRKAVNDAGNTILQYGGLLPASESGQAKE